MEWWSCEAFADGEGEGHDEQSNEHSRDTQRVSPWCATAHDASGVLTGQKTGYKLCRHEVVAYPSWGVGCCHWWDRWSRSFWTCLSVRAL